MVKKDTPHAGEAHKTIKFLGYFKDAEPHKTQVEKGFSWQILNKRNCG
jgi:hypothetical protein